MIDELDHTIDASKPTTAKMLTDRLKSNTEGRNLTAPELRVIAMIDKARGEAACNDPENLADWNSIPLNPTDVFVIDLAIHSAHQAYRDAVWGSEKGFS